MAMVPGVGPEDADIMIVGMNPGQTEQQLLKPFVGQAGTVLDRAMSSADITRADCYITNVVKHALPPGRKNLYKKEIEACQPFLDLEIKQVRPKVIVALGGDAISWFTGSKAVNNQRGRPVPLTGDYEGTTLLPTFHPASFLYSGAAPTDLITDLRMAKEIASGRQGLDYTTVTTVHSLADFRGLVEDIKRTGKVAFDLETTGLCPHPECTRITDVIFSASEGTAYVVQIEALQNDSWVKLAPDSVVEFAWKIILDPDIGKITHGGCYDYMILMSHGIVSAADTDSWIYDTQYGHHSLLDEHGPFYLETMAASATTMASWDHLKRTKYGGSVWEMTADERANYGGGDGDATWRLYQHQQSEIAKQWGDDGTSFYDSLVQPAMPVLAEIMANGFAVDLERLEEIRHTYKRQLRTICDKILKTLGIDPTDEAVLTKLSIPKKPNEEWSFNVGSDAQMITAIEDLTKIRWPRDRKWFLTDKGDRPSARKEVRNAMAEEQPHPIWNLWRDHKKLDRLLSQYITASDTLHKTHGTNARPKSITAKICPATGKVHTSLKPHGTRTGRRASRNPNLQNPPKRDDEGSEVRASLVRSVFVPSREDWKLVACDFDSAEVWVAAHLSMDPELLRIIDEGLDMHSMTAARVFGYDFDEFTDLIAEGKQLASTGKKLPSKLALANAQRTKAKVVNFGGILYGGGARKIARDIDTSVKEAQQILDEVAKVYSRFYEWRQEQVELIKSRGYVETAYLRRRHLNWPTDQYKQGHIEREAFNSPIQGTVADHMLRAMRRVWRALQNTCQGAIVLEMHDELISEVPAEHADTWLKAKIEAMTFNVPTFGKPIPVSGEIRDRWKVTE